jgi:indole-3-glycerol phosphate synthase
VSPTEDLLARLVTEARQDMQRRRALITQDDLELAILAHTPKDFAGALRRASSPSDQGSGRGAGGLAVIAEMKQRTPSMGVLAEDYRPGDLARAYTLGGAAAISVLTHMASFGGRPEHVAAARFASDLPILRKDFVTDPYEVGEARAAGADAILLIVAALDRDRLGELLRVARARGLAALVEVHDEGEVVTALAAGARLIGVNNRDLRTFAIDLGLTERLRKAIPSEVIVVAESGIHTADDARRMREAGADAILVGESLMRAEDPAARIRELASA